MTFKKIVVFSINQNYFSQVDLMEYENKIDNVVQKLFCRTAGIFEKKVKGDYVALSIKANDEKSFKWIKTEFARLCANNGLRKYVQENNLFDVDELDWDGSSLIFNLDVEKTPKLRNKRRLL